MSRSVDGQRWSNGLSAVKTARAPFTNEMRHGATEPESSQSATRWITYSPGSSGSSGSADPECGFSDESGSGSGSTWMVFDART